MKCQFQGTNCIVCGNYLPENAAAYFPTSIQCACTSRYDDYEYDSSDDYSYDD